ncbi:MAG TPA: YqeG family HAD IIIA-type phosphatase [Atribacteraceae bacterium]|nr:YqeG family HAD IIIA-type phosphatase [Atribacteraceae bacterium]
MSRFWERFFPSLFVQEISEIPLDLLWNSGIRGLILDLDNTIVAWNGYNLPPETDLWLKKAKDQSFLFYIVSNSLTGRVKHFSQVLGIPCIPLALKPRRVNFRKAIQAMALDPVQVAVIGDQIFTDVWGGNRMGIFTILVFPVNKKENVHVRLIRNLERLVLKRFRKRGQRS